MNKRLHQYRLLWRAAHAQAHPRAAAMLLGIGVILTVAVTAFAASLEGTSAALGWAMCAPAFLLLFDWSVVFLPAALGLNSPANAQLVPGARRRIIELALLIWLVAIGLLAAGLQFWPEAFRVILIAAICATLGIATAMTGSSMGLMLMLPIFAASLGTSVLPQWLRDAALEPMVLALLATGLVPLGILVIRSLFPQAGDRHWAMLSIRLGMGALNAGAVDWSPGWYWLQRLMLRRVNVTREPGALMLRGLGPNLTASVASGAVGGGAVIAIMNWWGRQGFIADMGPASLVATSSILIGFLFLASNASYWITHTRGEQALVRLAPAIPFKAAHFNHLLARAMVRQGLAVWSIMMVTTVLLALLSGARGIELVRQVCVCGMTLPALALMLRDHARRTHWGPVFLVLLAIMLSCIGPLAGIVGVKLLGLPFWPTATAIALVLTAVLVRQRWHLMCEAPIAFPAGRME